MSTFWDQSGPAFRLAFTACLVDAGRVLQLGKGLKSLGKYLNTTRCALALFTGYLKVPQPDHSLVLMYLFRSADERCRWIPAIIQ